MFVWSLTIQLAITDNFTQILIHPTTVLGLFPRTISLRNKFSTALVSTETPRLKSRLVATQSPGHESSIGKSSTPSGGPDPRLRFGLHVLTMQIFGIGLETMILWEWRQKIMILLGALLTMVLLVMKLEKDVSDSSASSAGEGVNKTPMLESVGNSRSARVEIQSDSRRKRTEKRAKLRNVPTIDQRITRSKSQKMGFESQTKNADANEGMIEENEREVRLADPDQVHRPEIGSGSVRDVIKTRNSQERTPETPASSSNSKANERKIEQVATEVRLEDAGPVTHSGIEVAAPGRDPLSDQVHRPEISTGSVRDGNKTRNSPERTSKTPASSSNSKANERMIEQVATEVKLEDAGPVTYSGIEVLAPGRDPLSGECNSPFVASTLFASINEEDAEINYNCFCCRTTEFRKGLTEVLERSYDEQERFELLGEVSFRTQVERLRNLRGRETRYKTEKMGSSYLDHHIDLAEKMNSAKNNSHESVNI
ncbi:hypothetical protein Tsubulata_026381, partial [Turnera subulata]